MRKREIINQTINLIWTILCMAPVCWFWFEMGVQNYFFYSFIIVSLITGVLPQRIINTLNLNSNRRFYERLGVKNIKKFVQNGDMVTSLDPYSKLIKSKKYLRGYKKSVEMYERYHLIGLIFFFLSMVYGFSKGYFLHSVYILISNIIYNICPILLQQYNKQRINKLLDKKKYF